MTISEIRAALKIKLTMGASIDYTTQWLVDQCVRQLQTGKEVSSFFLRANCRSLVAEVAADLPKGQIVEPASRSTGQVSSVYGSQRVGWSRHDIPAPSSVRTITPQSRHETRADKPAAVGGGRLSGDDHRHPATPTAPNSETPASPAALGQFARDDLPPLAQGEPKPASPAVVDDGQRQCDDRLLPAISTTPNAETQPHAAAEDAGQLADDAQIGAAPSSATQSVGRLLRDDQAVPADSPEAKTSGIEIFTPPHVRGFDEESARQARLCASQGMWMLEQMTVASGKRLMDSTVGEALAFADELTIDFKDKAFEAWKVNRSASLIRVIAANKPRAAKFRDVATDHAVSQAFSQITEKPKTLIEMDSAGQVVAVA